MPRGDACSRNPQTLRQIHGVGDHDGCNLRLAQALDHWPAQYRMHRTCVDAVGARLLEGMDGRDQGSAGGDLVLEDHHVAIGHFARHLPLLHLDVAHSAFVAPSVSRPAGDGPICDNPKLKSAAIGAQSCRTSSRNKVTSTAIAANARLNFLGGYRPVVASRWLGAGVGWVGCMNQHRGTEYHSARCAEGAGAGVIYLARSLA